MSQNDTIMTHEESPGKRPAAYLLTASRGSINQLKRPKALFVLDEPAYEMTYGPEERLRVAAMVDFVAPPMTRGALRNRLEVLRDVQVLLSGWDAPLMDDAMLKAAPQLEAIFYAAGAVSGWMTQAVWDRGIVVSSAYGANAIPVAEYALATTLFSLKHGWALERQTRGARSNVIPRDGAPGCCGSTVGIISLGVSGRTFRKLLRPFDLRVLAYDPYLTETEEELLDVENIALDELFRRADVVSLHAPLLAETVGMITGAHLGAMKAGATFINTARGRIVNQGDLIEVARRRPDLQFVLDVTEPEPLPPDSPLYTLQNVVLTPHIAGSVGRECRRMGRYMVEELRRYLAGEPLQWVVTPELAAISSHRPLHGKLTITLPAAKPRSAARHGAPVNR
jgi:phosphoglycerate dehydrogenase-like enzyme